MILSSVDLPEPFKPSTPIFAPGKKLRLMSRRMMTLRRDHLADAVHGIDVLCHRDRVRAGLGLSTPCRPAATLRRSSTVHFRPLRTMSRSTVLIAGEELGAYGFPNGHPFGPDRYAAFMREVQRSASFADLRAAQPARRDARRARMVPHARVHRSCRRALQARHRLARCGRHARVPAASSRRRRPSSAARSSRSRRSSRARGGAHSSRSPACITRAATTRRASACSTTAASRSRPRASSIGFKRVAYVDIDAHHGDGVFYAFERDPDVLFADMHEDGRFLYPGTGARGRDRPRRGRGHQAQRADAARCRRRRVSRGVGREVEGFICAAKPEF